MPIYIDPSSHFIFYEILCSSNFFVERHVDVVHQVLQVVGSKIFMKLGYIYHRKIHLKNQDGCFTNDGDISLYNNWRKKWVLDVWATKNCHKRQNDQKGRYTTAHTWENCKKVKIGVTGPKKVNFFMFTDELTLNYVFPFLWLHFLHFSQKCARVCWPFRSFCFLWNFV